MNREELSALQEQAFNELKDEFSRLQQQEKALRKSAGLPEEGSVQVDEADMTAEVRQACEEAQAKAKREGEARASQYLASTTGSSSSSARPSRRQGAMRV
ncbi:MAG: hypothetical protein IKN64_03860 [Desulfovibrio sp.]|nr:hypothetical protein [Desulfovibrio sp.]